MAYYNKLKDKLRSEDSLPEALSWENMEKGIYHRMGERNRKKRRAFYILFPVLAVFLTFSIFYFSEIGDMFAPFTRNKGQAGIKTGKENGKILSEDHFKENCNDYTNVEQVMEHNQTKRDETVSIQSSRPISSSESEDLLEDNQQLIAGHNLPDKTRHPKTLSEKKHEKGTYSINELSGKKMDVTMTSETTSGLETPETKNINPNIINSGSDIKTLQPSVLNVTENKSSALKYIEYLLLPQHLLSNKELGFKPSVYYIKPLVTADKKIAGYVEMYGYGGMSSWNQNFRHIEETGTEKTYTMSEKPLPGYFTGLRSDLYMNKNIFISTGVEMTALYSFLDYTGKKGIDIFRDNVLKSIKYNLLSNSSTQVYGDTLLHAVATRKVRHLNLLYNISVPILIGISSEKGRWTWKARAGGVFSCATFGKGKTIANGELVNFSGFRPDFNRSLGFGFMGNIGIEWKMSEKIMLGTQFSISKYLVNPGKIISENGSPLVYGIGINAGYRF